MCVAGMGEILETFGVECKVRTISVEDAPPIAYSPLDQIHMLTAVSAPIYYSSQPIEVGLLQTDSFPLAIYTNVVWGSPLTLMVSSHDL